MKRSKLLMPLLSSLSIVPALTICSCGDGRSEADKVADAIIKPAELTEATQITSFKDELNKLSSDDLKAELIYDIFGSFNIKGDKYKLKQDDSFASLYKANKVAIQTNITKCGLQFKNEKLMCYFLGYVSFVFAEDYSDTYKANDYVMLTYDIQDQEVAIDETACSLKYSITETKFENPCIGFAKIRYSGGKEVMQYISFINTSEYTIRNSHNWTK